MGTFNAKSWYEYCRVNCLYCAQYEACPIRLAHQRQARGGASLEDAEPEILNMIPWDGKQNQRCTRFEEAG